MTPDTSRAGARIALAGLFRSHGIATADLDARILVCAACNVDHAAFIRDSEIGIGMAADRLADWAGRRARREPVSRILGRREFWGMPIFLSPDVLDPRPETEGLVGAVVAAIGERTSEPIRILDLGTGSGAILCALLRELPNAEGVAVDRSSAACRIAQINLAALGFLDRASVVCASWIDAIGPGFDVVVSNPPYIRRGDLASLDRDVREHDPLEALDGGEDGLACFRAITLPLRRVFRGPGIAALECGWNQGTEVADLLRGALGNARIYPDLSGHDRVVLGRTSG